MYVIATVICPNFHFSVSPHVPFLNLLFEQIAIPTSIYLQKSASMQPRTSPSKFGGNFNSLFICLLTVDVVVVPIVVVGQPKRKVLVRSEVVKLGELEGEPLEGVRIVDLQHVPPLGVGERRRQNREGPAVVLDRVELDPACATERAGDLDFVRFELPGEPIRHVEGPGGICTRRAGKLYAARSRLYRSQILQVNSKYSLESS